MWGSAGKAGGHADEQKQHAAWLCEAAMYGVLYKAARRYGGRQLCLQGPFLKPSRSQVPRLGSQSGGILVTDCRRRRGEGQIGR